MDQSSWYWIDTRDKPGLLCAMMRALCGNAQISFEGRLDHIDFRGIPNVDSSASWLKRAGVSGEFIVLPLSDDLENMIWRIVQAVDHLGQGGIWHVQIGVEGQLAFAAYDHFPRNSVGVTDAVPLSVLDELKNRGVIRSYEASELPALLSARLRTTNVARNS